MTVQPAERVETDLSVIEALDFEESIACETYDPCSERAVWWAVMPCCSAHTPACDACRRRYLGAARLAHSRGAVIVCSACRVESEPMAIRFEPIKAT